ncbi:MAG: hypothetical protein OJF47_001019 [Nitrospira sp.]|jgi:uncharacterized protein (DUF2235 family)|nr:MAG: hypothetical protein OJF47_001019 [Nitrospira sp.]
MSKNIIVCTDGTWDHPDSKNPDAGTTADETNVFKFFALLPGEAQIRPAGARIKSIEGQTVFYDDGVGADGIWAVRVVEGATGTGLELKLQAGYRFVSEQYEEGDRIYLFGFSRGAYTARSIGGMLTRCGVPARQLLNDTFASHAFDVYRRDNDAVTAQFRKDYQCRDVSIEVIGVWDTVGALGIPLILFSGLDHLLFSFHDTSLHPNVRFGYHAVAIDEKRESFQPTLWAPREGVEQVWFAGVHGDIGGGYKEPGLSNVTLRWMLDRVQPHGLLFKNGTFTKDGTATITGDPLMEPMHDSYKPPFITLHPSVRTIPPSAPLHVSVQQRLEKANPEYRPTNLPPEPRTYVE